MKVSNAKSVVLCGNGWGAIASYKGLTKSAYLMVSVLSNDEELLSIASHVETCKLEEIEGKIIVFNGYKPFVSKEVLEKNCCINVHPSLLPSYRGLHSTVWAILNDEPQIGFTIHLMNEYMDDGDIIFQKVYDNDFVSTSVDYMELYNEYISDNLGKIVESFAKGEIIPVKQDKSRASWVGKRGLSDCRIDFSKTISYQKAFFRALVNPYPLPFFSLKGKEFVVKAVRFHPSNVATHEGRILNIDNEGVWVKIKDGYMVMVTIEGRDGTEINYSSFSIGQFLNESC